MALRNAISIGRRANPSFLSASSAFCNLKFGIHHFPFSSPHHVSKPGFRYSIRAVQEANTVEPAVASKRDLEKQSDSGQNWKIKMLYDGDCPLCMREVNMLRERNKEYGTIKFVDISSEEYSPEENQGLDYKTVMGRIHAILSDGTVVTDVEVATIANAVYGIWAKYRLSITGRPPIEEILESRRKKVCRELFSVQPNSCFNELLF
ncbi:hypothetical protein Cgig2_004188 [Carnegiea gigantea]|uniref:Thiol-disulfide oxidoreductase DCC n=1 Tax=Carnegiea gigantea TaxID=171969 RepID=A0A9Q1KUI0_9CARY|nr:hypothetical protein Cgig2_004188 [Carnegiea gigantea]